MGQQQQKGVIFTGAVYAVVAIQLMQRNYVSGEHQALNTDYNHLASLLSQDCQFTSQWHLWRQSPHFRGSRTDQRLLQINIIEIRDYCSQRTRPPGPGVRVGSLAQSNIQRDKFLTVLNGDKRPLLSLLKGYTESSVRYVTCKVLLENACG